MNATAALRLALCLALLSPLAAACSGGGGGASTAPSATAGAAGAGTSGPSSAGSAGALGARFDTARTVTVVVGGFDPQGASATGPFGIDRIDAISRQVAAMASLPLGDAAPLAQDQLTSLDFYGSVPPPYYSAQDVAEVAAAQRGVPRYAWIVAKFAREVLARSGARHVNLVAASLGGMITRYLIERDLEGLASGGRIARWVTIESTVGGVWAASQPLMAAFLATQMDPTDGLTLSYDFARRTFGTPDPRRSVSPYFADILVGHQLSGRPDPEIIAVASLMPCDGTLLVRDQWIHEYDARRAQGRPGAATVHTDTSHLSARNDVGLFGDVANFLRSSRRVTVRLVSATLLRAAEDPGHGECEVAFEARVRSPEALREWGHAGEIAASRAPNGTAPLVRMQPAAPAACDHVLFDWPVAPGERSLELSLTAHEENFNPFYNVYEALLDPRRRLDEAHVSIPVATTGRATYVATTPSFEATLEVEVFLE